MCSKVTQSAPSFQVASNLLMLLVLPPFNFLCDHQVIFNSLTISPKALSIVPPRTTFFLCDPSSPLPISTLMVKENATSNASVI